MTTMTTTTIASTPPRKRAARRHRSRPARLPLPPSFRPAVLAGLPKRHRPEAIQEAWLAYLEGEDPQRRVWNWYYHLRLHQAQFVCMSQVAPRDRRKLAMEDTD